MSVLEGKKIIVAKPGLDGHDVGAKVIALSLRDAGADVVYTGLRKTPEYIVRIAMEEDADAVGLSILSGSHNELVAATIDLLAQNDASDIKVFVGGTIPNSDWEGLKQNGVAAIFTADMKIDDVIQSVAEILS